LEGYVSGPISDTLGFRLAGKFSEMRGWMKNVTRPGENLASPGFDIPGPNHRWAPGQTSYAGRLTLKWAPTSDFTANFKFAASHLTGNGDEGNVEPFCSRAANGFPFLSITSFTEGLVYDPQSDCKKNRRRAVGAIPVEFRTNWPEAQKHNGKGWNILDTYLGSLNLNYRLGDNLTLTSVTGFTKLLGKNLGNYDMTSFATIWSAQRESARNWSQELRLASDYKGPLNFTFGMFFEDAKRSNSFNPILGFIGFDPTNGDSAYTFRNIWRNTGKTYSAYGQVRWSILDNLELAGGVRYTKEKKHTAGQNTYLNNLGVLFGLAPVGAVVKKSLKFSNWSPELTLSYKPSRNFMIYAAYKTGYKSGGLSTPATISTAYTTPATPVAPAGADLLAFKPERSKGFEVGVKGELFDRTVRFDLTAYRYTFSNLQLTSFNPALVAYFIRNAGKARTTGVEGSILWRATRELNLSASASYNRAKYVSFKEAQCYQESYGTPICPGGQAGSYDRSGQPLPRAPKFTFNAGFDYTHELSEGLKIGLSGEGIYTGSYWTSETGAPAGIQNGFWRLNAGVRIGSTDDRWELAFIGRNLTNAYYMLVSNDKVLSEAGDYGGYFARPRELVVQGTVKF
jgi:outer membrane receptor protein involved in Fe transport